MLAQAPVYLLTQRATGLRFGQGTVILDPDGAEYPIAGRFSSARQFRQRLYQWFAEPGAQNATLLFLDTTAHSAMENPFFVALLQGLGGLYSYGVAGPGDLPEEQQYYKSGADLLGERVVAYPLLLQTNVSHEPGSALNIVYANEDGDQRRLVFQLLKQLVLGQVEPDNTFLRRGGEFRVFVSYEDGSCGAPLRAYLEYIQRLHGKAQAELQRFGRVLARFSPEEEELERLEARFCRQYVFGLLMAKQTALREKSRRARTIQSRVLQFYGFYALRLGLKHPRIAGYEGFKRHTMEAYQLSDSPFAVRTMSPDGKAIRLEPPV